MKFYEILWNFKYNLSNTKIIIYIKNFNICYGYIKDKTIYKMAQMYIIFN